MSALSSLSLSMIKGCLIAIDAVESLIHITLQIVPSGGNCMEKNHRRGKARPYHVMEDTRLAKIFPL